MNFSNELAKQFNKYKDKKPSQLIKLLFHGSGAGNPKSIYESEDGLDIRFARASRYGTGIYFADNSTYSHTFAYRNSDSTYSMFLCYALAGNSAHDPPQGKSLRLPPLIYPCFAKVDRYDSVMNSDRSHTVTYSNSKSYPAYLITYLP